MTTIKKFVFKKNSKKLIFTSGPASLLGEAHLKLKAKGKILNFLEID